MPMVSAIAHCERKTDMKAMIMTLAGAMLMTLFGCQSMPPINTVAQVDLERFMGDWYVIANIPTFIEKDAYNAVESYRLAEDGSIQTTFTFNKGSHHGPLKTYTPQAVVRKNVSNAVWDMQFVWPFKAEYRIILLATDYSKTVVGRTKRDYVWIMARTPTIPDDAYREILQFLEKEGYDTDKVKKVPQMPNG
jgi:apolipoprotein D and lipocalin family protein